MYLYLKPLAPIAVAPVVVAVVITAAAAAANEVKEKESVRVNREAGNELGMESNA